jgi:peptidoglycan hydrolase-like protein with peptidoglycan-binding domain
MVNGGDVSAWFLASDAAGQPRSLRPAEPPMSGADVAAVQHALAAAKTPVPQNGVYDGATAAAVAHFQKQSGLNVDGVVDNATRQKLGVKAEAPPPPGSKPNSGPPGKR